MSNISVDAQIRYLIQWFNEWSELQKSDFLPILSEKYANRPYINGIVDHISGLNCQDKPMSLFECRVKLFKEWFVQWNEEQREGFLKQLSEVDPVYAEKITAELQNGVNGLVNNENHVNGEEVLED